MINWTKQKNELEESVWISACGIYEITDIPASSRAYGKCYMLKNNNTKGIEKDKVFEYLRDAKKSANDSISINPINIERYKLSLQSEKTSKISFWLWGVYTFIA